MGLCLEVLGFLISLCVMSGTKGICTLVTIPYTTAVAFGNCRLTENVSFLHGGQSSRENTQWYTACDMVVLLFHCRWLLQSYCSGVSGCKVINYHSYGG